MDEIRAIARLPGLDIEMTRRKPAHEAAEYITISMRADPSFAALGDAMMPAALAAFGMAPAMWWHGWLAFTQLAWSPWLGLLQRSHGLRPGTQEHSGG
ncbi:MAG TPA: hypothetical protein VF342_00995 [Alphaproteobacteria bacterium]